MWSSIDPLKKPTGVLVAAALLSASTPVGGVSPWEMAHTNSERYTVSLTSTGITDDTTPLPTFSQSLLALLQDFGIANKTLPELIGGTETIGELLGGSTVNGVTVDTSFGIAPTLDAIGLNKIDMAQVMAALNLPVTETVHQALGAMQLLQTKLDTILTPLGIPSTQTLLGLVERLSVANLTFDQLLNIVGFNGSQTLFNAATELGLSAGDITLGQEMGIVCGGGFNLGGTFTAGTTIDDMIGCVHNSAGQPLSGGTTVSQFLDGDKMPNGQSLGDYTLGQALGFTPQTTIAQFIDNLHVNPFDVNVGASSITTLNELPTLGSLTVGQLLTWMNLPPTETVAQLIDNFVVNSQPLGNFTIGDALDGLIVDPQALSTADVQDSTPLADFLTAMGFGTQTIGQLLNLTP